MHNGTVLVLSAHLSEYKFFGLRVLVLERRAHRTLHLGQTLRDRECNPKQTTSSNLIMTLPQTLFCRWILVLLALASTAQSQPMSLFERMNLLCRDKNKPSGPPDDGPEDAPADPPTDCSRASAFETCTTKGDPCGRDGLCIRTYEGDAICATDSDASFCFGSSSCSNG
jgi:hypothetical protein